MKKTVKPTIKIFLFSAVLLIVGIALFSTQDAYAPSSTDSATSSIDLVQAK